MKKIVGTIAAAALIASAAFADVGIGSWGRAVWTPAEYDDADGKVKSWEGISWGGNTARTGVSIHGENETIGFNLDLNADGGAPGVGDLACFWVKPFDFLTLKVGKTQDDTGRGNVAYGIFNWKRAGFGWTGEDVTFTRFGNGTGGQLNGAIVKVTPVEGLWAIAAFDVQDNKEAAETYGEHSQYGIGYDINGIGSIRAQYIGRANAKDKEGSTIANGVINAAFDLTAVDGLRVTVGAYIPLAMNAVTIKSLTDASLDNQIKLAAGADITLGSITLHALVVGLLPNEQNMYDKNNVKVDVTKGGKVSFGVGADINLGNGITLNTDVRYETAQDTTVKTKVASNESVGNKRDSASSLAILAGITKSVSNGYVGVGFQANTANETFKGVNENTRINWQVPVVVSAWF